MRIYFWLLLKKAIVELADGGNFIMKIYDLTPKLEHALLDLSSHFGLFELYKPLNSWADNAEQYVVGLNFSKENWSTISHNIKIQAASNVAKQLEAIELVARIGLKHSISVKIPAITTSLVLSGNIPIHLNLVLSNLRFNSDVFMDLHSGEVSTYTNAFGDHFISITWNVPKCPFGNAYVVTKTIIGFEASRRHLPNLYMYHVGFVNDKERKRFLYLEPTTASVLTSIYRPLFVSNSRMVPFECGTVTLDQFGMMLSTDEVFNCNTDLDKLEYINLGEFARVAELGFGNVNFALRQLFRANSLYQPKYDNITKIGYDLSYGNSIREPQDIFCTQYGFTKVSKYLQNVEKFLSCEENFVTYIHFDLIYRKGWNGFGPKFIEHSSEEEMFTKSAGFEVRRIARCKKYSNYFGKRKKRVGFRV